MAAKKNPDVWILDCLNFFMLRHLSVSHTNTNTNTHIHSLSFFGARDFLPLALSLSLCLSLSLSHLSHFCLSPTFSILCYFFHFIFLPLSFFSLLDSYFYFLPLTSHVPFSVTISFFLHLLLLSHSHTVTPLLLYSHVINLNHPITLSLQSCLAQFLTFSYLSNTLMLSLPITLFLTMCLPFSCHHFLYLSPLLYYQPFLCFSKLFPHAKSLPVHFLPKFKRVVNFKELSSLCVGTIF